MTINPIGLYGVLWLLCLVLIEFSPIQFNELSNDFYGVLLVSFSFFILGYIFFSAFVSRQVGENRRQYFVKIKEVKLVRFQFIMMFILIIITFVNIYIMTGGFFNFGQYRFLLTEDGSRTFINKITPFFIPVVFCGLPIMLYAKACKSKLVWFSLLLLVYFVVSGSRSIFIVAILILMWFMYFTKSLKWHHVLALVLLIVFGFAILGYLLGKMSLEERYLDHFFKFIDDDIPRNFFTLSVLSILKYMLGGLVAFSELTKIYIPLYDFNLTLLNVSKFSSYFGFSPRIQTISYVEVPFRTNVYTWFYSSYLDFGYYGVTFTSFLLGFLGSFLYKKCIKNSIYVIYLSTFYAILTLSIFHDYWYSSLFPYSVFFYLYAVKEMFFVKVMDRGQL